MSLSTTTGIPNPSVSPSISSSRRTSVETATRSSAVSSPALGPVNTSTTPTGTVAANSAGHLAVSRRNRAALRDFYGLKSPPAAAAGEAGKHDENSEEQEIKTSELDVQGFDAPRYVKTLLQKEGLEGILRTEGSLVSEIRSLDGDRKALVYDNYSKLITATDTIRKMRANMDPLAPTTSTLAPAISHIAGTAERLVEEMKAKSTKQSSKTRTSQDKQQTRREVETVKWVVSAPRRYQGMVETGDKEAAEEDWLQVKPLLEAWQSKRVDGAAEIIASCEEALK